MSARPPTIAPHSFSPTNPLLTRRDLTTALTSGFLDPLLPHMSTPHPSLVKLGHTGTHYDETAAQLEGFTRPLWALASLLSQQGPNSESGEPVYPGAERWVRGLATGTDPESEGYWGPTRDKDQRMVEMSPIGFALSMSAEGKEGLWGGLSDKEKENVARWIGGINEREMPNTNWLWFRVFANLGLRKVGMPHNHPRMLADLDHLDTFYLSSGWSRDGPPGVRQLDYYSGSFAIQYAQLVYSRLCSAEDPQRAKEYKSRAANFAKDFFHYFDPVSGAAIPFGRSTTYRMAMAAFWGALAFAFDEEDLQLLPECLADYGVIKGLLFRNLRWWAERHKTIFNGDGTLTIGYAYPNMYFTENYNSPGSPYWGMKAFIVLALPPSHPFWTCEEKPYPDLLTAKGVSRVGGRLADLDQPLHITVHAPHHTYLLSTGQACSYPLKATQAKYGKFSYSAQFGFCVPTGAYMLDQHALDGMIGFSDDGGETWKARRIVDEPMIERYADSEGNEWPVLAGTWNVFGDGQVLCKTWLVPPPRNQNGGLLGHWYLRVHRLRIVPGCTRGIGFGNKILSAEAGWAVYGQGKDGRTLAAYTTSANEGRESGNGDGQTSGAYAFAVSSGEVVGVREFIPRGRTGEVMNVDANASIIWPRTVLPQLRGVHDAIAGGEQWFVTGVYGRGKRENGGGWQGNGRKRKRGAEGSMVEEREWEAEWKETDGVGWQSMLPEGLNEQIVL